MNRNVRNALERVERAHQESNFSQQPRFAENKRSDLWGALIRWLNRVDKDGIPEWSPESTDRDSYLRKVWKEEPHMAGIINSVTSIDSKRQWTLTGGRNQVLRYDRILRGAEGGKGWRTFLSKASLSYYVTDMGSVSEVGRDGVGGPMRALYHVDSARCQLTDNFDFPLIYNPHTGSAQEWEDDDFIRASSLPTDDEAYRGLGFCAVSRSMLILQLISGVYRHDLEMLEARAPRGLLLLQNISEQQWVDAMRGNQQEAESFEREFFANVATIAAMGTDGIDAKLVPFSQLPDNFNLETATNLYMYGMALCFGYDPIEFWPVSAGALGRGRETEIQHRKSLTKGAHAFTLDFQDQLQRELPDALLFEFEERDAEGERMDADLHLAWAQVAETLTGGEAALSVEEARQYLAEKGVIPPDWTEAEEDTQTTAEGEQRTKDRLMQNYHIRRAIVDHPHEPIIQMRWPDRTARVLWDSGMQAMQRGKGYWYGQVVPRQIVQRADDPLYEDDEFGFSITVEDVARAINEGAERVGEEFGELLSADDDGEESE